MTLSLFGRHDVGGACLVAMLLPHRAVIVSQLTAVRVVSLLLLSGCARPVVGLTAASAKTGAAAYYAADTQLYLAHRQARQVRMEQGHEAAQPLYERLLLPSVPPADDDDPDKKETGKRKRKRQRRRIWIDATTATHLAACPETPRRLLSIGHHHIDNDVVNATNSVPKLMHQLREFLIASRFTCQEIVEQGIVVVRSHHLKRASAAASTSSDRPEKQQPSFIYASCPALYLKPAMAGSVLVQVEEKEEIVEEIDANNNNDANDQDGDDDDDNDYDPNDDNDMTQMFGNKMMTMPIIQSPAQCLVALFLLGLALPHGTVEALLDTKNLHLLQDLNLVAMSSSSSSSSSQQQRVFANVQIFPIHLSGLKNDMYIITDWHPDVLSSTCIRRSKNESNDQPQSQQQEEESPVMYIGPDSLALLQHLPLPSSGSHENDHESNDNILYSTTDGVFQNKHHHVLDLCTGSGIQAIASLLRQQHHQQQQHYGHATCVDISERALRFTHMNAMLNGLDATKQLTLIQGDLLDGQGRFYHIDDGGDRSCSSSAGTISGEKDLGNDDNDRKPLLDLIQQQQHHHCPVDLITANPPFLPVPPDIVDARHGFFSAGGPSGEDVLEQIVRLASNMLSANHHHHHHHHDSNNSKGRLAVVSEFFMQQKIESPLLSAATLVSHDNKDDQSDVAVVASAESLLRRIQTWWNEKSVDPEDSTTRTRKEASASTTTIVGRIAQPRGLLFTNQFPITAQMYARRRADNAQEADIWLHHLQHHQIGFASPGLLFVQVGGQQPEQQQKERDVCDDGENNILVLQHEIVPRSSQFGSIWTPSNPHVTAFTRHALAKSFGWRDDE